MAWLSNNAGTLASLCTVGSTIVGVIFYLSNKVFHPSKQMQAKMDQHNVDVPPQPIKFLQWIEICGQGFIDVVDFLIRRFSEQSPNEPIDRETRSAVIFMGGGCLGPIAGCILAFAIGLILSIFGVQDFDTAFRAGAQITCILVFLVFSVLYVYVVGQNIEKMQSEYYQSHFNQQVAPQEAPIEMINSFMEPL